MVLSLVVPSHGVGPRINFNIANVCALATDDVDVVIRDNSGNEEKRHYLSQIQGINCRTLSVGECTWRENYSRAVELTKNDFVFVIADDDFVNGHAIPTLCGAIDQIRNDPSLIGVTGDYIVEMPARSHYVPFNAFINAGRQERIQSFFEGGFPSILSYTPLRKSVMKNVLDYIGSLPVFLSYHDFLMHGLYLLHGKIAYIDRYIYQYFNSNWSDLDLWLRSDARYLRAAGLDTSGVRIQPLVLGFEGAQTFLSKYQSIDIPPEERFALAFYWLNFWRTRLPGFMQRQAEDAKFDAQALQLGDKWRVKETIVLPELLADISEYYALSSPEIGQRYYNFWR